MTDKDDDNFGDWRIRGMAILREDVPPAYLGGPSHKAGTPIYQATSAKNKEYGYLTFITPDTTALALNIAYQASQEAMNIKKDIRFKSIVTPGGNGKAISDDDLPSLYDFFEHCMISVTFSFQALETFANLLISAEEKIVIMKKDKSIEELTPDDAERRLSTEEKFFDVLPSITNIPIKRGGNPGQNLISLKKIRDSTIHLKSKEIYSKKIGVDGEPDFILDDKTLFFQFLKNEPKLYPYLAQTIIEHFSPNHPRWLTKYKKFQR